MTKSPVFAGRVIFDHLPKTAGQAINSWLTKELGGGCVTTNLNGQHEDLIRLYGGEYSIISGHVYFQGNGLDPRYHYMTSLREPLDRVVSWLFLCSEIIKLSSFQGCGSRWNALLTRREMMWVVICVGISATYMLSTLPVC